MALQFQQPNFDPNERKKKDRQALMDSIQGIPSLMFQYQELKRKREVEDREYSRMFGTGEEAQPGVEESEIQKMKRLGLSGYNAETNRMNAMRGEKTGKREGFLTVKNGKTYDLLTDQPITSLDPDVNYSFIKTDDEMEGIRAGNLSIRKAEKRMKVLSDFNSNAEVKQAEKAISSANTVRAFIDNPDNKNNPVADEAVKVFLARATQPGALSDTDLRSWGGSKAFYARLSQATQQFISGTMTKENREFMLDVSNRLEKSSLKNYERTFSRIASQYGKIDDIFPGGRDEVMDLIMPSEYKSLLYGAEGAAPQPAVAPAVSSATPQSVGREPDVEAYAKKYGISYEEAMAIKQKRMGK